jgi:hypothetical protein
LSTGGLLLYKQRKIALIEFLEPVVPRYFFQRILSAVAGKIEANHTYVVAASGATNT